MSDDVWVDFDGDGDGDDYTTEAVGDDGTAYTSDAGEVAIDNDGDGLVDELYTDEDGDGKLDTLMEDTDGDGYVDNETSYEGDPLASDEGKGGESGEGEKSEGESSGSTTDNPAGEGGLDGLFS